MVMERCKWIAGGRVRFSTDLSAVVCGKEMPTYIYRLGEIQPAENSQWDSEYTWAANSWAPMAGAAEEGCGDVGGPPAAHQTPGQLPPERLVFPAPSRQNTVQHIIRTLLVFDTTC